MHFLALQALLLKCLWPWSPGCFLAVLLVGVATSLALPRTVGWLPGLALRCSAASDVLGLCLHTSQEVWACSLYTFPVLLAGATLLSKADCVFSPSAHSLAPGSRVQLD